MTNEELKKKIKEILRKRMTELLGSCHTDEIPLTEEGAEAILFYADEFADALIAAGIGDVTEWKERAEKAEKERDEWKERAERMHKERISKDYGMKEYQRITEQRETPLVMSQWSGDSNSLKIYNRLSELEDKIESGELCDRKETAREILILLGKGFDETTKKDFKDLLWYESFCRELKFRYGVELLENLDKLEE